MNADTEESLGYDTMIAAKERKDRKEKTDVSVFFALLFV